MRRLVAAWSWRPRLPWARHRPHGPRTVDIETVRRALHGLLHDVPASASPRLHRSLRLASEVSDLWHLRAGVMQAIAGQRGEAEARGRVAALDALFLAHWPQAPVSRPAPLG
jgi:hypothetical protein